MNPVLARILDYLDGKVFDATFSISDGNPSAVTVQLRDADGNDMAERVSVPFYLTSDANGDALASAPGGGIAIGTDGLMIEELANQSGLLVSESDGDIDINVTDTTDAYTAYLVLVMPNGRLQVSSVITPTS